MNWDFSNAKISQSSIGPNARTYNGPGDPQHAELLGRLAELRGAVLETAPDEEPPAVVELIDQLDAAVASGRTDPADVVNRWDRIRGALSPALQASAAVAQITSLVVQLVNG
jgi:hypothetical protein